MENLTLPERTRNPVGKMERNERGKEGEEKKKKKKKKEPGDRAFEARTYRYPCNGIACTIEIDK